MWNQWYEMDKEWQFRNWQLEQQAREAWKWDCSQKVAKISIWDIFKRRWERLL